MHYPRYSFSHFTPLGLVKLIVYILSKTKIHWPLRMVMLRLLSFIIQPINLLTLNVHNTTEIFQTRSSAAVNQYSSTEINGASVIYSS